MSDIQEQIKIAHRKALEQDFNEIIKELKQEEHKNLELSMRINKAIEYINNNSLYEEEYDYDYEENIHLSGTNDTKARNYLLKILKGSDKK